MGTNRFFWDGIIRTRNTVAVSNNMMRSQSIGTTAVILPLSWERTVGASGRGCYGGKYPLSGFSNRIPEPTTFTITIQFDRVEMNVIEAMKSKCTETLIMSSPRVSLPHTSSSAVWEKAKDNNHLWNLHEPENPPVQASMMVIELSDPKSATTANRSSFCEYVAPQTGSYMLKFCTRTLLVTTSRI